jgi:hypothetical protein
MEIGYIVRMKRCIHLLFMAILALNLGSSQHMAKVIPDGTLTALGLHMGSFHGLSKIYELPSRSQAPSQGKIPTFRSVRPVIPMAMVSSVPLATEPEAAALAPLHLHIPSSPSDTIFHPPV